MKRLLYVTTFFIFAVFCSTAAYPQEKTGQDQALPSERAINPDEHVHGFFETMIKGKWREAPAQFLEGSRIVRQDPLAPDKIVQQLTSFGKEFGIPNGYEMLQKKTIKDSMIYFVYVLKFPVKPVIWEFYYYKFSDKWELININLPPGLAFIRDFIE